MFQFSDLFDVRTSTGSTLFSVFRLRCCWRLLPSTDTTGCQKRAKNMSLKLLPPLFKSNRIKIRSLPPPPSLPPKGARLGNAHCTHKKHANINTHSHRGRYYRCYKKYYIPDYHHNRTTIPCRPDPEEILITAVRLGSRNTTRRKPSGESTRPPARTRLYTHHGGGGGRKTRKTPLYGSRLRKDGRPTAK